jgi:hypothetical protein
VTGRTRGIAGAVLIASLALAAGARGANCDPWPGEPDPLPSTGDPDPVRAEWAQLRSKELTQAARRFETEDPVRARQMWRRLLCMNPSNDEALAGVMRARAVRVYRPPLVDEPFAAGGNDAWEGLNAPIGLRTETPPREIAKQSEFRDLRGAVGALEEQVRTAQFERAIASAPGLRSRLSRAPAGGTRASLIAQTEVLTATAQLALGRGEDADASLRRALAADPALALDPTSTPPKVVRALDAVRQGPGR